MRAFRWLVALTVASSFVSRAETKWPVTEGDGHLRDFRFQSGAIAADLKIHYRTLGALRRDAAGTVRNAVMVLHGTGGSGTQFLNENFADELFGPGQALDITKFYVILPDGIGHGKSSKPSDGLRAKFPRYGYNDMVEAQFRLLNEHLRVDHLRLILGTSMGCMQIYVWAERHAGLLDAAMPMACQPAQIAGRNLFFRQVLMHAIRDDPSYRGGDYTENPPGARTAAAVTGLMSGNPLTWQKDNPTREEGLRNFDKAVERRVADANDMLYAADSSWDYNPAPELSKIRTPVLHINFADDMINPPELRLADELLKQVPTARFILWPYTSETRGHGSHTMAALWKDRLAEFLRETERR